MIETTESNKKIEIYIPIEIKPREFTSQVYLAGELAKNGARVFIGSKSSTDRLVNEKDNDQGIYLYKGGGSSVEKFRNISKKVTSIIVLDQEISPALKTYEYIRTRFVEGSLKYVSRLYYVGCEAKESAIKYLKDIEPEKIVDSGWPRVDLWRPSNHHIWKNEINKIHEEYGDDFIFFSADFGANSQRLLEERSRRVEIFGAKKTQHELEFIRKNQKNSYENFNQFIDFLHEMDSDSRIPPIIVRPHPSEDHKIWIEKTKNLIKTKVVYRGNITPWLLASKGLLHRGCTTAIEAAISQIKAGFLVNYSTENNNSIVPKLSPELRNIEDVVMWVNDDFNGPNHQEIEDIISSQITFPEGGATKYIAEDMLNFAGNNVNQSNVQIKSAFKKVVIKHYLKIRNKFLKYRKSIQKKSTNKKASELGKIPKYNKMQDGINSDEIVNHLDVMYPKDKFRVVDVIDDLCIVEKIASSK